MPRRLFTREEAQALLPRLTELLTALQAQQQERVTALQARSRSNGHQSLNEGDEIRAEVVRLGAALVERVRSIHALGVLLKDPDSGLIDFPALRDGREVYLCWRLGEGERIGWWHEVEAGFAGRQPIGEW